MGSEMCIRDSAIERGVVLARNDRVEADNLPPALAPAPGQRGHKPTDTRPPVPGSTIADLERHAILETLKAVSGSTSKAARILGISPRKIQYKLHEYGHAGGAASLVQPSDDE